MIQRLQSRKTTVATGNQIVCIFTVSVFLVASTLFLPNTSQAYTCATAGENGPALSWVERTLFYVLDPAGTADIPAEEELQVLRDSFEVWNEISCSDIQWVEATGSAWDGRVGFDYLQPDQNINSLHFYDSAWPHSSLTIALTTLTFSSCTGELIDADMEINSHHFDFTTDDLSVSTDLKNTAVHEIGHMFGLDHSDDPDATMYPYAAHGETLRRSLAEDDIDGLCFRYPAAEASRYCATGASCPSSCRPPEECGGTSDISADQLGGCSATRRQPNLVLLTLLLVGAGIWIRRAAQLSF